MNGSILLDTSAVIGVAERGDQEIRQVLGGRRSPTVRSVTVLAELCHGVATAPPHQRAQRQQTAATYDYMTTWQDGEVELGDFAAAYGRVATVAGRDRIRIGQNDLWVIAEADVHRVATLLTADRQQATIARQHFAGSDASTTVVLTGPAR